MKKAIEKLNDDDGGDLPGSMVQERCCLVLGNMCSDTDGRTAPAGRIALRATAAENGALEAVVNAMAQDILEEGLQRNGCFAIAKICFATSVGGCRSKMVLLEARHLK